MKKINSNLLWLSPPSSSLSTSTKHSAMTDSPNGSPSSCWGTKISGATEFDQNLTFSIVPCDYAQDDDTYNDCWKIVIHFCTKKQLNFINVVCKTPNEGYILFHIVRVNSTPFTNGFYRYWVKSPGSPMEFIGQCLGFHREILRKISGWNPRHWPINSKGLPADFTQYQ